VKRPPDLLYGVDDKPPLPVTLINGVQHVCSSARNLIYPLVIFKLAGASVATIIELLSVGLVVLGIGTFLQSAGPPGRSRWKRASMSSISSFMRPTPAHR
jgi:xanthine/uracil permease